MLGAEPEQAAGAVDGRIAAEKRRIGPVLEVSDTPAGQLFFLGHVEFSRISQITDNSTGGAVAMTCALRPRTILATRVAG